MVCSGIVHLDTLFFFCFCSVVWIVLWRCVKWLVISFSLSAASVWLTLPFHLRNNLLLICWGFYVSFCPCNCTFFGHPESVTSTIVAICPCIIFIPLHPSLTIFCLHCYM